MGPEQRGVMKDVHRHAAEKCTVEADVDADAALEDML